MASIKVPIMVDGLQLILGIVKNLIFTTEFPEETSEEYKKGFYDFADALINALIKMQEAEECEDN